jgi:hypothetical protein
MYLLRFVSPIILLSYFHPVVAKEQKAPSPIRIAFFVSKSPNITYDEFHHHYSTHHGPLVTPWLKQYGVIEYNQVSFLTAFRIYRNANNLQYHSPPAFKAEVKPLSGPGTPVSPFDAWAEFLVTSVDAFNKAFEDPFYAKYVKPDEDYLFDRSKFGINGGYRQTFWTSDNMAVGN